MGSTGVRSACVGVDVRGTDVGVPVWEGYDGSTCVVRGTWCESGEGLE